MSIRRERPFRSRAGGPPAPGTRDELTGYLEGLAHRVDHAALPPDDREKVRGAIAAASRRLSEGDLPAAEQRLREAEELLDADEEETELTDRPRGLVAYVPSGARGSPPSREEEPLANRMLLVERLWHVRRADGFEVEALREPLGRAEAAYRRGDREIARRLTDEVHAALESARRRSPTSSGREA